MYQCASGGIISISLADAMKEIPWRNPERKKEKKKMLQYLK